MVVGGSGKESIGVCFERGTHGELGPRSNVV